MMSQTRDEVYKTPRSIIAFYTSLLGLMTIFVLVFLFWPWLGQASHGGPSRWLAGILLVGIGWLWYWHLTMAYEIRVRNAAAVEFRSALRRNTIAAQSIRAVKLQVLQNPNVVAVMHTGGKLRVLFPMHEFYKFLTWLKETNPAVEIRNL